MEKDNLANQNYEKSKFVETVEKFRPFEKLMESAESRKDFYVEEIIQSINIPGLKNPVKAVWKIPFGNGKLRGMDLHIYRDDSITKALVEIGISDRWDGTQEESNINPHYFDVNHRLVNREIMTDEEKAIQGLGSFALKQAEESICHMLDQLPERQPVEIGMIANQPSVFKFAKNNGYEIKDSDQEKIYEMFVNESEFLKEDLNFVEHGILPHFRIVNMEIDTPEGVEYVNEQVVVNLDNLRKYCESVEEGSEKYHYLLENGENESKKLVNKVLNTGYVNLVIDIDEQTERKDHMREKQPHPFLMDFYFCKNL